MILERDYFYPRLVRKVKGGRGQIVELIADLVSGIESVAVIRDFNCDF